MAYRVGPTGTVHTVEPHPELARDIRRRVRRRGLSNVTVHECAVAAEHGHATLSTTTDRSMSSLAFDHGDRTYTVETKPLAAIVDHADIGKMDVEGGEHDAIVNGDVPGIVDQLVCELHPHRIGKRAHAVYDALADSGRVTTPAGDTIARGDIPMVRPSHIVWYG